MLLVLPDNERDDTFRDVLNPISELTMGDENGAS